MKKKTQSVVTLLVWTAICLLLITACAPAAKTEATQDPLAAKQTKTLEAGQLPVRYQNPAYMLGESSAKNIGAGKSEGLTIPVGADISSNTGPVALRDIMKKLAVLKEMNISWASDVDQMAMVDVDIRAEDDFFKSLENILRQKDYFHEVQGNTIVVKYRETRKFHVAMPFLKSTYNTGVGGDVLGGGAEKSGLKGNIQLTSEKNDFDVWGNISTNLDQILGIWEETVTTPAPATTTTATGAAAVVAAAQPPPASSTTTKRNVQAGKGYYSIDKPIGLITVTAPRPLVEKIAVYLENFKTELYRQISIEAKIVEVSIDDTESRGIDWTNFLTDKSIDFQLFGSNGVIYEAGTNNGGNRVVSKVSVTNPFSLALNFLDTQGHTTVLANPKLSVMNGQPGLITAGDSVKYIDKVESRVDGTTGSVTYTVTTATLMSGIGMSVIGTIMDNDEIILTLTPVTSKLENNEVTYINGWGGVIGVPRIKLREMNTTVRIKSGQVVVVGGLIDNAEGTLGSSKVPFLGDLPLIGNLFSHSAKSTKKSELVIMLQPTIL
ncbi:type II and III secretion system protein [Thiovibrio frasassiensis]|uniref:Type II and III secretion system protein n=1 Tax=Thiovibrio frasassiensis TaxID=2984131 RepID=A0A9X4MGB6_9BACT|nr:type II and III secretion system protein [Thiovibrio frasassiensis]MDG4475360.1 type II and III secretion system protein [Thiovibrio frasassiensis]